MTTVILCDIDKKYNIPKSAKYIFTYVSNPVMEITIDWYNNKWTSCHDLMVYPDYRGIGLGHILIEFAKRLGVNNLSVNPKNKIAIKLYREHGFIMTGSTEGENVRMTLMSDKYVKRLQ